ncbi:hypothetical protein Dtox_1776 [Desulfofarcimen acetoxidans DSM 771]|jgi:hypothetical protein|uniref:Uncharacterized protein n=1 Tax=Desulfofarcimen acetoxidans (strain ATCC 49208 / DSM 771 / KCTC 5769 / VKM B-1644 / 5575) TaxID=485916 RepID=C8VX53_DESAS|nr:hypothetical protein [Desulfofarcimen acetoxidans]ACV62629.1 hypothetical protein Dtox_1776 [Desulfofarcimen acetoxidans DSM 771]
MKTRTFKIIMRKTLNEVESLKSRMEALEEKLMELEACRHSESVVAAVPEEVQEQVVNRSDLVARDKEFLRKISIIKQTQMIIRAKYEEQKQKRRPIWEKIIPRWIIVKNP